MWVQVLTGWQFTYVPFWSSDAQRSKLPLKHLTALMVPCHEGAHMSHVDWLHIANHPSSWDKYGREIFILNLSHCWGATERSQVFTHRVPSCCPILLHCSSQCNQVLSLCLNRYRPPHCVLLEFLTHKIMCIWEWWLFFVACYKLIGTWKDCILPLQCEHLVKSYFC